MKIGDKRFDDQGAFIMGILNVTPDSFSDGGRFLDMDAALNHAEDMIRDGADLIDVGGESTRPGYVKIPVEEEIERTASVIEALKRRFDVPVSLDTYKTDVAREGLKAGADMINDIWGLKTEGMAELIAEYDCAVCIMHNQAGTKYESFLHDVWLDLSASVDKAERAGIQKEKIMIDPGVGFGKTKEQNLLIIKELGRLRSLNYPILLGTSRKSVIGLTLELPVTERMEGTVATTLWGRMQGASWFRVHDVRENKRALLMWEAIRTAH